MLHLIKLFLFLKVKQILTAKLTDRSQEDLKNLCNKAWARYSDGITASVSSILIEDHLLRISPERRLQVPFLFCGNEEFFMFSFYILTLYDSENPSEDIYFIYETLNTMDREICGYMCKIYQDRNDTSINRN